MASQHRFALVASLAALLAGGTPAGAQVPSASAPPSAAPDASATPPPLAAPEPSCVEKIPTGKARPPLSETFPARGLSGHALSLELSVVHGQAESVLPTGFQFQSDTAGAKSLKQAGFILPDPKGGAGPVIERTAEGDSAKSKVRISFVALPKQPGRNQLTLPALPITMARANGELFTLCTKPHPIVIEDPTANTPNPKPKHNPPPQPQREEWTALKNALAIGGLALMAGALSAWLISRWLKRPKPVPPPPPPRPPWEAAREALHDLRHAGLTREQRFSEHFDRVSDIVRRYLGDRYGFDGLESTTRELLGELRKVTPHIVVLAEIERFLRQADLVKFARLTPTEPECVTALADAEQIVERTIPPRAPEAAASGSSSSVDSPPKPEQEDADG